VGKNNPFSACFARFCLFRRFRTWSGKKAAPFVNLAEKVQSCLAGNSNFARHLVKVGRKRLVPLVPEHPVKVVKVEQVVDDGAAVKHVHAAVGKGGNLRKRTNLPFDFNRGRSSTNF
jgi:hypothetical protein